MIEGWRRIESGLEGFEFGIEEASVGVMRAEALGGVMARGEAVLLEGTVDVRLLLELLQSVRRPAHCVRHLGGESRGMCRCGWICTKTEMQERFKKI